MPNATLSILHGLARSKGGAPRESQDTVALAIEQAVRDEAWLVVEAGTGTGKALALDTPIPTPSGWSTMGALKIGDLVFDELGRPCRVTWKSPVWHGRPCYRVQFDDGSAIVADQEHEWATLTAQERKRRSAHAREDARGVTCHGQTSDRRRRADRRPAAVGIRTTGQISRTLRAQGRANHSIDVCPGLNLPDADLPIDPYVLGLWLADGTSNSGVITTADEEVLAEIRRAGYEVWLPPASSLGYRVGGLTAALRPLGLLAPASENKHIPMAYARCSSEQRLALLQGLMDGDGTCERPRNGRQGGQVEFTTVKWRLAVDVRELICSLGFKPGPILKGTATLNGIDCGPKYRICWTPNREVFRLPRKRLLQRAVSERSSTRHRFIERADATASVPVQCIEVDSTSHLYLAGESMIPTHNSWAYSVSVLASSRRLLVVTKTKALQDQLAEKDLPELFAYMQSVDGRERKLAVLKGRSNYGCLNRIADLSQAAGAAEAGVDVDAVRQAAQALTATKAGEWDQLPFKPEPDIKAALSVTSETCKGPKCKQYQECYVTLAKRRAKDADAIVANHALFGVDTALGGNYLPRNAVVVIDECHELPETIAERFGAELRFGHYKNRETGSIVAFADAAARIIVDPRTSHLADIHRQIRERLAERAADLKSGALKSARLRKGLASDKALAELFAEARPLIEEIRDTLAETPTMNEEAEATRDTACTQAENLMEAIDLLGSVEGGQVEYSLTEGATQVLKLVDVRIAHLLRRYQWTRPGDQYDDEPDDEDDFEIPAADEPRDERRVPRAVILCSATIADNFEELVGLDARDDDGLSAARRVNVAAPFDYRSRTVLYMPTHLPSPSRRTAREHRVAAQAEMAQLTEVALRQGKGVLMLCSSFEAARGTERADYTDGFAYALRQVAEPMGVKVFVDGDEPKNELIAKVKRLDRFVLVASQGFFTGVDLPNQLALVGIDKAPLPTPDDPVVSGFRELIGGRDVFTQVDVPLTAQKLGQGAGRLNRSLNDAGVVAIFDSRIGTTDWGWGLTSKLPDARRWKNLASALHFLENLPGPVTTAVVVDRPDPVQELQQALADVPEDVLEEAIDATVNAWAVGRRLTKRIPVPAGRYAVPDADGVVQLVEVSVSESTGFRFVQRVLEGSELSANLTTEDSIVHLETIERMGWERCLADYGRATHRCGAINAAGRVCNLPLSNSESQTLGIGSECRKRLSMAS